jgi:hypothetical protein
MRKYPVPEIMGCQMRKYLVPEITGCQMRKYPFIEYLVVK